MDVLLEIMAFPLSVLLGLAFLLGVGTLGWYMPEGRVIRFVASRRMAQVLLLVGAAMLAVEGIWAAPVHRSVLFACYVMVLMAGLELTVLRGIRKGRRWGFLLNHAGLFLIVWAAFFGAPDVSRSKMLLKQGYVEHLTYAEDGRIVTLPFDVALDSFCVERYGDGVTPRQFTSCLRVDGEVMETSVNHPCFCDGYLIYQDGYDVEGDSYTVLQFVRNGWLPVVYMGMVLLAAGSLLLLFGRWRARLVVPITLVLTVVFTVLTVAKINFGMLMPALRSWWFVPHLFIYMLAYSLMCLALVLWLVEKKKASSSQLSTLIPQPSSLNSQPSPLSHNLARSASALLIIGMLTGSVWAQECWGDYWAWDPKENWAAVTWFVALVFLHLKVRDRWVAFVVLGLSFLALQITWYGVDYLPSAAHSLHVYGR